MHGGPCSATFSIEILADHRMQMAELESDALDLVILSQINAHHFSEAIQGHQCSSYTTEKKDYTVFYCKCRPICLTTLLPRMRACTAGVK